MNQFDIIINIFGIILLFVLFYLLAKSSINKSKKKFDQLITEFHLNFYKISNKKCTVKRLNKITQVEIKDTSYLFDKCNIYVENDFTLIQGFRDSFLKSAVRSFIITNDIEKLKNKFNHWTVLRPKFIELNQNQIKIVYTANTNNSDYSLIINDLNYEDYDNLSKIKNYCQ